MFLTRLYKILKKVLGRPFLVILSILLQILWFAAFITVLGFRYPYFAGVVRGLSLLIVLVILNRRVSSSYKLAWTLLILALPLVGFAIYLMFGNSRVAKKTREQFRAVRRMSEGARPEDPEDRAAIEEADPDAARQSRYLRDYADCPVYRSTETLYFPEGDDLYKVMIEELEKARHFIFMEYFIIDNGEMWGTILKILERKAHEGLDVRIIYDDVGCVGTLPAKFYKELRERGIKCEVFNPFRPIISVILNNRDHRKIMVIDGHTGFTGGINLADEYINRKQRFGHWKDTGIMLHGEAVWNFTVMFLQMWSAVTGTMDDLRMETLKKYHTDIWHAEAFEEDGFVQPYGDSPLDDETVGENVYLHIINNAQRYVHIFTPYLIIDEQMMTALCLAAKSGVDVRIVTPGIPDKRAIFQLSRSYYAQLIEAGVHIYEYMPGFLHAKCFVCDDEIATVGTVNLDFRSLYMHFECGVWMYRSSAVAQVREDLKNTIGLSKEINLEACISEKRIVRLLQSLLRLLAPML